MFVGGVKGETPDNVIQVSRYKLFHENNSRFRNISPDLVPLNPSIDQLINPPEKINHFVSSRSKRTES